MDIGTIILLVIIFIVATALVTLITVAMVLHTNKRAQDPLSKQAPTPTKKSQEKPK